jgi:hypothetical protein
VNAHPDEASTDNNEASTSVDVLGPYEPPKGDEPAFLSAPGPWAAAMALAVAASVATALAGRRRARGRRRMVDIARPPSKP